MGTVTGASDEGRRQPIVIPESGLYRFSAGFSVTSPLPGQPIAAEDFRQEWLELVKVNDDGTDGELLDLRVAELPGEEPR